MKIKDKRKCSCCGQLEGPGKREIRPYGKDGADICFECMTSSTENEQEARKQFAKRDDAAIRLTRASMLTPEGPIPFIGRIPE